MRWRVIHLMEGEYPRVRPMRLAAQFRTHAEQCGDLADAATSVRDWAYWTSMAQLWQNLASHLDATHPASEQSSVFPPLIAGNDARDARG